MIGYKKPFRSWGRSLLGDKNIKPFAFNFNGNQYQMMQGNYICTFDGKNTSGLFLANDLALENNLILKPKNKEIEALEIASKAFLQDYMERIMDKRLTSENK